MGPKNAMARQLQSIAGMTGQSLGATAQPIGQYVTAAMLAAAAGECDCETCKLMAKAAALTRKNLLEVDEDGGS